MKQNSKNVSPMSNQGRNSYVVAHLTDALLLLLAKKPMEEISIRELTERAGVGRASFYRNFDSKEAILRAHVAALFGQWATAARQSDGAPLSEQIRIMIAHFEAHRAFYSLVSRRGMLWLIKDSIIELCGPKPGSDQIGAYASAFAAYALYGWAETWFLRGMTESSDELAALFRSQGL